MRQVTCTLLALAVLLPACATNRYVGPTSGRSADVQWGVSEALDRTLAAVNWEVASDKTVAVAVATLTEGYGGRSAEERYLEEAVRQRLQRAGARIETIEAAEMEVRVLARAMGANRTRRDFIPLYYAELVEGIAELQVQFLSRGTNPAVLHAESRAARAARRRTYFFYIFGPLVKEWFE